MSQISASAVHSYIFGAINKLNSRILCDSGAFCCCVSLYFYNKIKNKPPIVPRNNACQLKAANNVPLDVLGTVELDVSICGVSIPVQFYVVRNLSQNCILGGSFFEECGATINYGTKTLSLYENSISVPMLNDVELDRTLRTTTKLRIPPLSEVIFSAKLNKTPESPITGITEAIPSVRNRGLLVANVLQDSIKPNLTCRMLNTTRKVVYLPANFAFGYLSSIDVTEGVNLIDVDVSDDRKNCMNDVCDEPADRPMPDHDARLAYLQSRGVQIGTDVLDNSELQELTALLYSYRDIFACDYKDVPAADIPPHKIVLTDNKIVNERRFRYNPAQERLLEERCDDLLKAGMLRESTSVWNSPVFLIKQKGDRSARFLVDFRAVNAKSEPLYCSLPSIEEVFDQIGDEKPRIYTVLDLKCGYYSVPLDESSCQYTAFSTKNKHLEFTRLPQGYRNAPTVFTQALSNIFAQELRSTLLIYIDDLICFNRDVKTHLKILEQILAKFRKFKLRLHPSKLRFAMSSVKFLGYDIGRDGYTTDTSRTSVIKNYPRPKSQRDIKKFTGLCNYYRRTIRSYSKRAEPLRRLLIKDTPFVWTDEQERAFCDLKQALCNPPVLGFPDRNKPMRLTLDGSQSGLSYTLSNLNEDGTETVLHYGARATTKSERNYSATDLELAALLTGIRTFNSYLANTHFEVFSDHISLTYIRNLKFATSRLVRASIMLSQYDFSIRHLSGKENRASDAISRIPNLEADDLTLHEQKRCTNTDDDLMCNSDTRNDDGTNRQTNDCVNTVQNDTSHNADEFAPAVNIALPCSCRNDLRTKHVHETRDVCCGTDDTVCECEAMTINDDVGLTKNSHESDDDVTHDDLQTRKQPHFVAAVIKRKRRNKTKTTRRFGDNVTHGSTPDCTTQANDDREPAVSASDGNYDTPATADNTGRVHTNDALDRTGERPNDSVRQAAAAELTADNESTNDMTGITLAAQSKDSDFYHLINYLLYGTLPTDTKIARRTILLSDYYTIVDGKLFHLMVSRRKNNKMQESLMKQLCIPGDLRANILHKYHSQLLHAGSEKLYLTMRCKIYWPNMYNDVRDFVANCETCYKVKANTHAKKAKIQTREIPKTLFHTIHIDHLKLAVPNATHQYNYVLIIIDELSLQIELVPTKTTAASECANALMDNWICRYGVPAVLISDRHKSFTAGITECLLRLCGIKHMLISTKNPRSNGICEQTNSRIINAIKIHCANNGNWPKLLPAIAGAYRAAVTPTRQHSPFFLMYGFHMKLPIDNDCSSTLPAHDREDVNMDAFRERMRILRSEVQAFAQGKREQATAALNKSKTATEYQIGQKVYLANEAIKPDEYRKSAIRYTGPYLIIAKSDHNTYKLSHIYTGKILKSFMHFDKLRISSEARKKRKTTKGIYGEGVDGAVNSDSCCAARTAARGIMKDISPPSIDDDLTIVDDDATDKDVEDAALRSIADRQNNTIGIADDADAIRTLRQSRTTDRQTADDDDKESTDSAEDRQNSTLHSPNTNVQQLKIAVDTSNHSDNMTTTGQTTDVGKTRNDVTTLFAFDDDFFDVCDVCTNTNNVSVEDGDTPPPISNECCRRRLHKKASEMKQILKITRSNGCLRCHVSLHNGRRLVCRPVQVPSDLLCTYRLHKYYKTRK